MAEYQRIEDLHTSTLPAWDGTSTTDPGCTRYGTDGSRAVFTTAAPPSTTVKYDPVVVIEDKSPKDTSVYADLFYKLRKQGVISMNPYFHNKTTTRNLLAKVPEVTSMVGRLCAKLHTAGPSNPYMCHYVCANSAAQTGYTGYNVVGDAAYWGSQNVPEKVFSDISYADIVSAITQSRQDAVVKSYKDYDALTEICELRQTVDFFKSNASSFAGAVNNFGRQFSLSDLKAAKAIKPRDLRRSSKKIFRKIGSAWLAYRYAIMPIVYSMLDIQKVILRNSSIDTSRGMVVVKPQTLNPGSLPSMYLGTEMTGNVTVRSTVVCVYKNTDLSRLDAISFNPISTAWELIPYSFVVDWFLNVGDFITANLSADLASQVLCCTSIRKQLKKRTWLHVAKSTTINGSWSGNSSGYQTCFPVDPPRPSYTLNVNSDQDVKIIEYDHYERILFSRATMSSLNLKPSMNWRRYLDSAALSLKPITKLAKALAG